VGIVIEIVKTKTIRKGRGRRSYFEPLQSTESEKQTKVDLMLYILVFAISI
jgi:hypothetical protein